MCVVYSAQCTVYSAVHSVQCTVYSAVGCGVQCTVYSAVVLYQLPATRSAPHSSQNAVGTDHMCPSATDPVSATKHFVRIFLQIRRGVLFKMSSKKGTLPENRFSDSHISLQGTNQFLMRSLAIFHRNLKHAVPENQHTFRENKRSENRTSLTAVNEIFL